MGPLRASIKDGAFTAAIATDDGVADAARIIESHRKKPTFVPPGPAFDAKTRAEANRLVVIPNARSNPVPKGIISRMIQAKSDAGLYVVKWQNQGQATQWVQSMEFAAKNKFTGVRSSAKEAGTPVSFDKGYGDEYIADVLTVWKRAS